MKHVMLSATFEQQQQQKRQNLSRLSSINNTNNKQQKMKSKQMFNNNDKSKSLLPLKYSSSVSTLIVSDNVSSSVTLESSKSASPLLTSSTSSTNAIFKSPFKSTHRSSSTSAKSAKSLIVFILTIIITMNIHHDLNVVQSLPIVVESIPLNRIVRQTIDGNNNNGKSGGGESLRPYLNFENVLPEEIVLDENEQHDYMIECDVSGTPNPIIYWLRNGKLIEQQHHSTFGLNINDNILGSDNNKNEQQQLLSSHLGLSRVKSRLYLECLNPDIDSGNVYTCVAVTPYQQKRMNTKLIFRPKNNFESLIKHFDLKHSEQHQINDKESELYGSNSLIDNTLLPILSSSSSKMMGDNRKSMSCMEKKSLNSPAKIYFWTQTLMENMGNNVLIHCRATGYPKPRIDWFINNGQLQPINTDNNDDGKYKILSNGDLLINNVTFDDMGVYRCTASNELGSDMIDEIFFYPTIKE